MKALLVRIGIDQAYGGWNAPVDVDGSFVYVPIPEKPGTPFHPGLERCYGEVLPALQRFCVEHGCGLRDGLRFPQRLLEHPMHLDPDFECLTYGDKGNRRGAGMVNMRDGDLLVFYGGLRPVHRGEHALIYALMGMTRLDQQHLKTARLEQLEQRDPVNAGRFHDDRSDVAGGQPIGQGDEVGRAGAERTDMRWQVARVVGGRG
jgi:hypothetical protein